ncbi:MAG: hypothetical protein ABI927_03575 [Gaiellaceae bacterium]
MTVNSVSYQRSWVRFRWLRLGDRTGRQRDLDLPTEALAEGARVRRQIRMGLRDRLVSLGLGTGFLFTAALVAVLVPTHRSPSGATVALLVAAYALTSRVEFEIGAGSAVPSQLVLVPMLFVLPLGQVPLWAAAGYLLGELPDYVRGRAHPERALVLLSSSWYAIGPTVVLAIAGERPPAATDALWYVAALAAQFAFDAGSSLLRDRVVHGVGARLLARYLLPVYGVDVLLAPAGLLASYSAVALPLAVGLVLPLVVLLAVFARERRARIDHALELGSAYLGTGRLAETFHEILPRRHSSRLWPGSKRISPT